MWIVLVMRVAGSVDITMGVFEGLSAVQVGSILVTFGVAAASAFVCHETGGALILAGRSVGKWWGRVRQIR